MAYHEVVHTHTHTYTHTHLRGLPMDVCQLKPTIILLTPNHQHFSRYISHTCNNQYQQSPTVPPPTHTKHPPPTLPPSALLTHPPTECTAHPPSHRVHCSPTLPPSALLTHPPTECAAHPPSHRVRCSPTHPPSALLTHPPTECAAHPPSHRVRCSPTSALLTHPPTECAAHPPTHRMRCSPTLPPSALLTLSVLGLPSGTEKLVKQLVPEGILVSGGVRQCVVVTHVVQTWNREIELVVTLASLHQLQS